MVYIQQLKKSEKTGIYMLIENPLLRQVEEFRWRKRLASRVEAIKELLRRALRDGDEK